MQEVTSFYSVAIVFSKCKKKILLGKRRDGGKWTSPAGGGHPGESPEDCAIRELFEEANIKCKKSDLKSLTSKMAGNGKPIFLYLLHLKTEQDIHPKNDPDKEVPSWKWFKLDELPELDKNRLETTNMAKMKMGDLIKSIVSTDMFTGVDLNTQDFSQDDMASRDTYWHDAITALVKDIELNVPVVTDLEDEKALNIIRIGEGIYSGNIKDKENGDKIINFNELSIASLIQMLKAKEFIGKEEAYKKDSPVVEKLDEISEKLEVPSEGDSDVKIDAPGIEGIKDLMDKLKNIHVEGDLNITIKKSLHDLINDLYKAANPRRGKRGFPVGTKRTWSNGVTAVKHADGWVVVGGQHHGKLMGKFKEEAKEHHLKTVESAEKDVEDIKGQIEQLKAAHEEKKKKIQSDHDKMIKDLKTAHEKKMADIDAEGAKLEEKRKGPEKKEKDSQERERRAKKEAETRAKRAEKDKAREGKKDSDKRTAGDDGNGDRPVGDVVPKDKESEVAGEDKESKEVEDSPREEAPTLLEQTNEYENARDSKVTNLGEDLLDSARHKVAWRTAEEAEATGQAKKVVMRNKMLKDNPVQLAGASNVAKAAFLYQVMHSLPQGPDYKMLDSSEYQKLVNDPEKASPQNRRRFGELNFTAKNEEEARKEYIDVYNKMKTKVEELNTDSSITIEEAHTKVYEYSRELRRELNGTTGSGYSEVNKNYSLAGQQLYSFTKNAIGARARWSKALRKVGEVLHKLPEDMDSEVKMSQLMEGSGKGKTLAASFKVKSDAKAKKTYEVKGPAQFYVTDKAKRKGPDTKVSNMKDAQKALTPDGEFQMRGVQYGNSVTDSERVHHTTKLAESMQDLTDILGLPSEMASFNGRLGMAIGARGHGTAMAHYESHSKVINLTRKNGVGSLAHEWGHMMDNVLAELNGGKSSFLSSAFTAESKSGEAMQSFKSSDAWKKFKSEVNTQTREMIKDGLMSVGKFNYWNSDLECFARSFEAHVQHKLEAKGRENTYLSAAPRDGKLWPNTELRKELAPHFDKLMEEIKASGDLKKALKLLDLISNLKEMRST